MNAVHRHEHDVARFQPHVTQTVAAQKVLVEVDILDARAATYDLHVTAANITSAKAMNDTSGALLEAKFQIRTYVKTPSAEGEASGS